MNNMGEAQKEIHELDLTGLEAQRREELFEMYETALEELNRMLVDDEKVRMRDCVRIACLSFYSL